MEAGEVKQDAAQEAASDAQADGEAQAAPQAVEAQDEYADALAAGKPKLALVRKYDDRIPVELKSKGHLEQLKREHSDVEVIS